MKTILLDIGGSFIKRADHSQVHIPSSGSREEIAAALREAISDCSGAGGIGVSIPGPFDYVRGIFLMRHKYTSAYGESFRELAGIKDDIRLRFMHDVNAPLLGALGMLGLKDAALVTLGTGLGFSYAKDGRVQQGPDGSPAIKLWNRPWGSGILEDIVSARGITGSYAHVSGEKGQSALSIALKARAGDVSAQQCYLQVGATLGEALKPVLDELGIHTLLAGGQISKSLDLMLPTLGPQLGDSEIIPLPEDAVFAGLSTLFD